MAGNHARRNLPLIIILAAACAVFVWAGCKLFLQEKEYSDSRSEYEDLREAFWGEKAPSSEASAIDFEGLKKVNPDIKGWIDIPDTDISYPIVQAEDNAKYLSTSFEGKSSKSGAIFLDKSSQGDLRGRHNIIYGHHMRDGSMFAQLIKFRDADFFDAHSEIKLSTPAGPIELEIISVCAVKGDEALRRFEFTDGEFKEFIDECMARSIHHRAGIDTEAVKALYTFVTCSYEADDMRTLIHAIPV